MVAKMLAGYEIDWGSLIAEQIPEVAMKRSISFPFPYLIYRLCIELRG